MTTDTHFEQTRPGRDAGPQTALLLTIPEAAARLRISRWSFYKLVHARRVQTIRLGSRHLISVRALERLANELDALGDADHGEAA